MNAEVRFQDLIQVFFLGGEVRGDLVDLRSCF
jgi:hypothetical protein